MTTTLLALPTTTRILLLLLLLLLFSSATTTHAAQWPHNLPRSAKYYPEHQSQVERGVRAQQKLTWQQPVGMKKLSDDPSEKFYLHYWDFLEEGGAEAQEVEEAEAEAEDVGYGNMSSLLPAIAQHTNHERHLASFLFHRRNVFARDFKCPTGTTSCGSVASDLCCQIGESCINTAEGVGCCPAGATCGNEVGDCDTAAGYTSCPGAGEGCCIPGAVCVDGGCEVFGTATVTRTLPLATATATTTSTISTSSDHATTSTSAVSSSRSCTSGFHSCAATLGGGCCRTDQVCGTSTSCLDRTTTSSATAAPPVRPTSGDNSISSASSSSRTTTTTSTTAATIEGCPTGFYMCSAVYLGGCCRVDRNCDTTSCPPSATTAVVTTSGLTIAVASAVPTTGSCANGWATCGADVGGGCCPSGYQCASNCINTALGGSNTTKMAPESASPSTTISAFAWAFVAIGIAAGLSMILL
ncbi:hypothetical protein SMMN14_09086 [Sphaerulina musiva]